MKTCEYWLDCPCECHGLVTRLFEMAGRERIPVPNPEYHTPVSEFWMPTAENMAAIRDSNGVTPPGDMVTPGGSERAATGNLAPATGGLSGATIPPEPNRRHRGELEAEVKRICDQWSSCVPSFIAESVDPDVQPSTGAVTAVLLRWERLGFAIIGRSPLRFAGYTETGKTRGLDVMKYEAKQAVRRRKNLENRGYRNGDDST